MPPTITDDSVTLRPWRMSDAGVERTRRSDKLLDGDPAEEWIFVLPDPWSTGST